MTDVTVDNIRQDKALFITALGEFCKLDPEFADLDRMEYRKENTTEYVYICYKNGSQKRINVSCDSHWCMHKDIINNIETADYLPPSKCI